MPSNRQCFQIIVAYDGTNYVGWQMQPNGPTIQSELQSALASLLNQTVTVIGSGRTDSGVHAIAQSAHFVTDRWSADASALVRGMNAKLPDDIAVLDGRPRPIGFHAIADAKSKRYRYQLQCGGPPDPIGSRHRWRIRQPLDAQKLRNAAAAVIGRRDFSSMEAAGAPRADSIRDVVACDVDQTVDPWGRVMINIEVQANGFLYNMVRNIVGTLVWLAQSHRRISDPFAEMVRILDARDRGQAGPTAPPHGLHLLRVWYDD